VITLSGGLKISTSKIDSTTTTAITKTSTTQQQQEPARSIKQKKV